MEFLKRTWQKQKYKIAIGAGICAITIGTLFILKVRKDEKASKKNQKEERNLERRIEVSKKTAMGTNISLRRDVDDKKRELLQKEIQKASEKIYHLPISDIFDDLKILKAKSTRFSFAQIYDVNLLLLRLCQRHLCQVTKQARRERRTQQVKTNLDNFGKNCIIERQKLRQELSSAEKEISETTGISIEDTYKFVQNFESEDWKIGLLYTHLIGVKFKTILPHRRLVHLEFFKTILDFERKYIQDNEPLLQEIQQKFKNKEDTVFIFGRKIDDAVFEKYAVEEEDVMKYVEENPAEIEEDSECQEILYEIAEKIELKRKEMHFNVLDKYMLGILMRQNENTKDEFLLIKCIQDFI